MGRMYTGKKIREVSGRYVETLGRMNASIVEYILVQETAYPQELEHRKEDRHPKKQSLS